MVPGAALARCLPAAVPVRGVVPVAGAHCRAGRAHGRDRGRGLQLLEGTRGRRMSAEVLERLRVLLRDEGGLMATLVDPAVRIDRSAELEIATSPAAVAARGPRTKGRHEEYELLVEAIYEGYLLHYGSPRVVRAPEADLGLLAGDQLYAMGLARLVELGDTLGVAGPA